MPTKQEASCTFHCTFYKCGSQWIRDVLCDPALVLHSQVPLRDAGRDVPSAGWPVLEAPGLASPIYTAGIADWLDRPAAAPGDRCLVVLRDPRDIIVSLVMSLALSHTPNEVTSLLRLPLRHAERSDRIRIGIHLFTHWAAQFRSWLSSPVGPGELRMDYAELIGDEQAQFRRIFAFLGWSIPDAVATEVIARHSFLATSGGRRPGEENEFSHRRKGIAGDWRNHFTRETGAMLEEACAGLLRAGRYAETDDWWQSLPAKARAEDSSTDGGIGRLLTALAEQETQLSIARQAAEQRGRDVEELHELGERLRKEAEVQRMASEQRLRDLNELDELCRRAQQDAEMYRRAAEERLRLIQSLDRKISEEYATSPWDKILRFCGLPH